MAVIDIIDVREQSKKKKSSKSTNDLNRKLRNAFKSIPIDSKSSGPLKSELKHYRELVRSAFEHQILQELDNGHPREARYIFNSFFEQAEQMVCIYTEHLPRGVRESINGQFSRIWSFPSVIDAAMDFLSRPDTRLRILIRNQLDGNPAERGHDHPFLVRILEDPSRRGEVEIIVQSSPLPRFWGGFSNYFAVADDKMYRLETDRNGARAFASFNDQRMANRLQFNFGSLVEKALRDKRTLRINSNRPGPFDVPPRYITNLLEPNPPENSLSHKRQSNFSE